MWEDIEDMEDMEDMEDSEVHIEKEVNNPYKFLLWTQNAP